MFRPFPPLSTLELLLPYARSGDWFNITTTVMLPWNSVIKSITRVGNHRIKGRGIYSSPTMTMLFLQVFPIKPTPVDALTFRVSLSIQPEMIFFLRVIACI